MIPQSKNFRPKFVPTTGPVRVGGFFVCNCGIPLSKRTEKGYELLKYHNGQPIKIKTEFDGMMRVKCEKCGRGFAHIKMRESIGVSEKSRVI